MLATFAKGHVASKVASTVKFTQFFLAKAILLTGPEYCNAKKYHKKPIS